MNKVIEYIIRAKDATAAGIASAIARVRQFAAVSGGTFSSIAGATKKALPPLMAISSTFGMMKGAAGQAARALSAVASSALAFGPVGAAIAAVQVAISMFAESALEAAQRVQARTAALVASCQRYAAHVKAEIRDNVIKVIDDATKSAERLGNTFDRIAAKRAALQKNVADAFGAKNDADVLKLQADMNRAVHSAKDEDREKVAAEWLLKIAEKKAQAAKKEAEYSAAMEAQAIKDDEYRLKLAERAQRKHEEAAEFAEAEYQRVRAALGSKDESLGGLAAQRDRARALAEQDKERQADLALKISIARDRQRVNEMSRANSIKSLNNDVASASYVLEEANAKAAQKAADAEMKAKTKALNEEERLRVALEKKIHDQRIALLKNEVREGEQMKSMAEARLASAIAAESQAWGWYRNRDAWKAQLAEEKANAEAEKQFETDFDHLKRFRSSWRTSTNLSEEEEIVRRVGLAREQREQAEDYARQTAQDTARAAAALESIEQAINEGSAE